MRITTLQTRTVKPDDEAFAKQHELAIAPQLDGEAVELELTPKPDRTAYDRKLHWYIAEDEYAKVHWFAPSAALRSRLLRVAHKNDVTDFMLVSPLPPGHDYLPPWFSALCSSCSERTPMSPRIPASMPWTAADTPCTVVTQGMLTPTAAERIS